MMATYDPRSKGVVYGLVLLLTLITLDPRPLVGLVVVQVIVVAWWRVVGRWLGTMRVLAPTLVLFAVAAWFAGGESAALAAVLRLVAVTTASVLYFAATTPEELGEALQASGLAPQRAFVLEGALRFVPTMGALVTDVRDAQASRGIRLDGWRLFRNAPALLAPVLVSALRLGDALTEALETRGFGSGQRTLLRDYRWRGRDLGLVVVATVAAVAYTAIVLAVQGGAYGAG